MNEFVTPHLRSVLKIYQDSATKSLQGPGSSIVVHSSAMKKEIPSPDLRDEQITPAPPPLQPPEIPQPVLSAADTGRSVLYETILEGKQIGCFLLGGEMRLCFPQVLNNVLMDFGLDQINRIFDDLRIFCSQCSPDQLNQFKAAKILPEDVNTSGLITRTNAERLCSALLHRGERPLIVKNAISFRVIHRCFGKCEGICTPELYSYKEPGCIRCIECNLMFSPQRFVCHVHSNQENSTLHWGFDSNNWRAYLQVAEDEENREKYATLLDELREREQRDMVIAFNVQRDVSSLKRKGYTPLHLAVQFGKDNIFELLCNVYKANRDTLDWSGKKPLDYRKQSTSISASTYSKKDLGFLRIGSLNVRVKKTTEAFSNFLGVGNSNSFQYGNHSNDMNHLERSSMPVTSFDLIHKTWGSADNIPPNKDTKSMMPPKFNSVKKRRSKRAAEYLSTSTRIGHRSVPTTPNQTRSTTIHSLSEHPQTESDSDTAGFDSNWK